MEYQQMGLLLLVKAVVLTVLLKHSVGHKGQEWSD